MKTLSRVSRRALLRAGSSEAESREPAGDLDAVLLGENMDMAHALRATGARVTVVGGRHTPARFSRYDFRWRADPRPGDARLVGRLIELAAARPAALFYETDRDLLFVSRNRHLLGDGLRLVLPPAGLIEQLVDKGAFEALAQRLDLCVPPSWVIRTGRPRRALDVQFPVLVKPCMRDALWAGRAHGQKAFVVHDAAQLDEFLGGLAGTYDTVVVQTYVPGSETRVESYHVYINAAGHIAAEFTGRKIRTCPSENGFSTALITTDSADVRELGRSVVRALNLVGVAKLDFKRDPDGKLWLLEVNPRFNLWHRIGAKAGVNIPQIVMADLCGRPRPPTPAARPGVAWCHVPKDLLAAREAGLTCRQWLSWARKCDTTTGLDVTDPLPFLAGRLWPLVAARVRPTTAVRGHASPPSSDGTQPLAG
ncbi:MAG: putative ATP-dependent carboligase, ATP-grasp superfamily [Frankiales bacterium]|nr:putative ATP-dependent carboligase, ATP-grasp superfamily [Frankiales bacterium]